MTHPSEFLFVDGGVLQTGKRRDIFLFLPGSFLTTPSARAVGRDVKSFVKTGPDWDLGEDGLLYALGTNFFASPWANPASGISGPVPEMESKKDRVHAVCGKYLRVSRSTHGSAAACCGAVEAFVGRQKCHSHTLSAMGAWYGIELLRHEVSPTQYSLLSSGPGGGHFPKNWKLEASADGSSWVTLSEHEECADLCEEGKVHSWALETRGEYHRLFRVVLTGNDAKGKMHLCLSGFELWGELREVYLANVRNSAEVDPDPDPAQVICCGLFSR